ncbi:hypothetical protein WJX72_008178 [[Myrmecia] bisecta]|uniref:ARID domain-containing protein n=1 Tax=[Myrmecia] bisecta TaxID=41462 RepID=A0AAW1PYX2_9CHLO
MAHRPAKWRILAVFCNAGTSLEAAGGTDRRCCGAIEEFSDLAGADAEVQILKDKKVEEVAAQLQAFQPNLVYLCGASTAEGDTCVAEPQLASQASDGSRESLTPEVLGTWFEGLGTHAVYADALCSDEQVAAIRAQGVGHVVFWGASAAVPALQAAQFGHAFFATLRNYSATILEAFALASHSSQAHCTVLVGGQQQPPALPLLSSEGKPDLPDNASVPHPIIEGLDTSEGLEAAVPGWAAVRLLAPHAELRLLACGQSLLIDAHRLSFLGQALRAMLVMELRLLSVISCVPCDRVPAHLPPGCMAVRCSIRTHSGAHATVVLGGPANVLQDETLVEHALRQTLVSDALSLQFKVPPPGVAAPVARSSQAVACGASVVDALVVTSVWAVHVLRTLCQDSGFRGLVSLGIGAVGGTTVSAFSAADSKRYTAIIQAGAPGATAQAPGLLRSPSAADPPSAPSGPASYNGHLAPSRPPGPPHDGQRSSPGAGGPTLVGGSSALAGEAPPAPAVEPVDEWQRRGSVPAEGSTGNAANGDAKDGGATSGAATPGEAPSNWETAEGAVEEAVAGAQKPVPVWESDRPSLSRCSEAVFLKDLVAFLEARRGRKIDMANFPEAVLNGAKLDLFNLYKEVCQRGGYRLGNGINWKGQVFPSMHNFTSSHRMTGVGNALKRHYQLYLWEYEQAHPGDVTGDSCAICGGGDEVAADWISCDMCDVWVHFSCDPRPYLGSFKDYAKGNGRNYVCIRCNDGKRQKVE